MAIVDAFNSREAHDDHVVHVFGEPGDVTRTKDGPAVLIAGYDVIQIADAMHDGQPARRFTLAVDGITEVGRLVVRTGIPTEYTFEWDLIFDSAEAAEAYVERIKNPPKLEKHTVVQTVQDLAFEDETLEEAIAGISAAHGVSITVLNPSGPGGGWPEVRILGRYENVHELLCVAWGYSKDYADGVIRAVNA